LRLSRVRYTFSHAINSDKESRHYSTDFPAGGREVRDFNRNLMIDRADAVDPFTGVVWPDEDVTFSSMFVAGDAAGHVTNVLGEEILVNGVLDPGEDIIPDQRLDRGILTYASGPSPLDLVPWSLDRNNGGFVPFRHPYSRPGPSILGPAWEYETTGVCGFQTAIPDGSGPILFQT